MDTQVVPNLPLVQKSQQHKRTTSTAFDSPYIKYLMFSVKKSCYGVMQQAYSMPSIVMNGEQVISTGQKWRIQV